MNERFCWSINTGESMYRSPCENVAEWVRPYFTGSFTCKAWCCTRFSALWFPNEALLNQYKYPRCCSFIWGLRLVLNVLSRISSWNWGKKNMTILCLESVFFLSPNFSLRYWKPLFSRSIAFREFFITLRIKWWNGYFRGRGLSYLPTPPLGQDMTQGQFLSGV